MHGSGQAVGACIRRLARGVWCAAAPAPHPRRRRRCWPACTARCPPAAPRPRCLRGGGGAATRDQHAAVAVVCWQQQDGGLAVPSPGALLTAPCPYKLATHGSIRPALPAPTHTTRHVPPPTPPPTHGRGPGGEVHGRQREVGEPGRTAVAEPGPPIQAHGAHRGHGRHEHGQLRQGGGQQPGRVRRPRQPAQLLEAGQHLGGAAAGWAARRGCCLSVARALLLLLLLVRCRCCRCLLLRTLPPLLLGGKVPAAALLLLLLLRAAWLLRVRCCCRGCWRLQAGLHILPRLPQQGCECCASLHALQGDGQHGCSHPHADRCYGGPPGQPRGGVEPVHGCHGRPYEHPVLFRAACCCCCDVIRGPGCAR
jgi:hypothetical protein